LDWINYYNTELLYLNRIAQRHYQTKFYSMTKRQSKVPAITKEIKLADEALREWKAKEDPLAATMVMQYELLKKDLLKDLLVELVQSGVSFKSAGAFIQRLTAYIQKIEKEEKLSENVSSKLAEVEKLLAG